MDKNSIMTTRELAEYIKLNEKTVLKMANDGKIPGVKIGNQWRFRLETIDNYLQNDIVKSSDNELDLIIKTAKNIIPLSRFSGLDYIKIDSQAKTANEVLSELAEIAYDQGITESRDKLLKELEKRERMLSTAIGNQIAVPHLRHPSPEIFKTQKMIMIRTCQGIDFSAPDNQLVRIFFMICAPNEFIHLRLLAKIAKLLKSDDVIKRLISSASKDKVLQVFMEFDRECMFSNKE